MKEGEGEGEGMLLVASDKMGFGVDVRAQASVWLATLLATVHSRIPACMRACKAYLYSLFSFQGPLRELERFKCDSTQRSSVLLPCHWP